MQRVLISVLIVPIALLMSMPVSAEGNETHNYSLSNDSNSENPRIFIAAGQSTMPLPVGATSDNQASEYITGGEESSGDTDLEPGRERAPMEPGRAYYDFGVFAFEDGDYEDAESNLSKALEKDAENPYYNHFMGKTYQKMERHEKAMHYLNRAWQINPDVSGLKYDLGLQHFKMSNYKKAADLFIEVAEEDPSNVLAYYYAGISSYKQKDYESALKYFFTAAEKSPSIKINGFYYAGICYRKLGKIDQAVEHFEYVRENTDSESLRENAEKWLQEIERYKVTLRPFNLYVKLGYAYDDNVRLEPLDEDIYADEDDYCFVGYISGRYKIVNRDDIIIGVGYSHYQTVHNQLKAYDLVGSIINFYTKYQIGPVTFGFSYLPSFYWLDGDTYMRRHQLRSEIMLKIDDNLSTRVSYNYYLIDNVQDNNRDGHTNEPALDVYYNLREMKMFLFCGIAYEVSFPSHRDQDYRQLKAKLGVSAKLPWQFNLNITGKYSNKRYENVDSIIDIRRKDDKYYGAISLSRVFYYDWLSIIADFNYTKNDSNINVYNYKRQVATLSLSIKY